jgi:hypothetical protein
MNLASELLTAARLLVAGDAPVPTIIKPETQAFVDELLAWLEEVKSGKIILTADELKKRGVAIDAKGAIEDTSLDTAIHDHPLRGYLFNDDDPKSTKKILITDWEKPYFQTAKSMQGEEPEMTPKDYFASPGRNKQPISPSLEQRKEYISLLEQKQKQKQAWNKLKKYVYDIAKPFIKTPAELREMKKQQKQEGEKQHLVKIISQGAMKKVHDTLQSVVESIHPSFVKSMSDWLMDYAKKFESELEHKGWLNRLNEQRHKKYKEDMLQSRYLARNLNFYNQKNNTDYKIEDVAEGVFPENLLDRITYGTEFAGGFKPSKYRIEVFAKSMGVAIGDLLEKMLEVKSDESGDATEVVFEPEAKRVADEFGEEQYRIVAENYLNKNIDKLALIIENKEKGGAGVTSVETTSISHAEATFESIVHIDFQDGTGFLVDNKAVSKRSLNGIWFYQYPTTFHKVRSIDGSVTAMVPEAAMLNRWSKESKTTASIASELLKVARMLVASSDKKDIQRIQDIRTKSSGNLHKAQSLAGQMANAIKDKVKMHRRWEAAKSEYPEIADMFAIAYKNLTGEPIPGEKEVRPDTPEERKEVKEVKPESIELKGDESVEEMEKIFKKAIRDKRNVKFTYSVRDKNDESKWITREENDLPKSIGKTNMGNVGVQFAARMVPMYLIGDPVRVIEKAEKYVKDKTKRDEARKKLIELCPELETYFGDDRRNSAAVDLAWAAITSNESAKIKIGTDSEMLEGPYGAMETVKYMKTTVYLIISSGEPMDGSRMGVGEEQGDTYWTDDEGNTRKDTGYGRGGFGGGRRRYHY